MKKRIFPIVAIIYVLILSSLACSFTSENLSPDVVVEQETLLPDIATESENRSPRVIIGSENLLPEIAMFRANPAHTGVYADAGPKQFNELIWEFRTDDGVWSSPAVLDGVVYFGSFDGYLYAVDINTGQEQWKFKTDAGVFSSPAVSDGVVYFGNYDGYIYALK